MSFKCGQCEYTNATKRSLSQHDRIKHRISQIDGMDDITEQEVIQEVKKNFIINIYIYIYIYIIRPSSMGDGEASTGVPLTLLCSHSLRLGKSG